MNTGKLDRQAIRIWVANRFYYQVNIPIKDAAILSNCPLREVRRLWLHRIADHDGAQNDEGGIGAWLRLGGACGLSREALLAQSHVVPGVRYAVDAYVHFARSQPWPVAVASSLTELFSRDLIALRMDRLRQHYPWLSGGLDYFTARLDQAPEDARFALQWVTENARTRSEQELAIAALRAKCDILWAQLDALYFAYVQPGWPPPGAFRIRES
jgi:pyrroloquinoline-quinone synthase